MHPRTKKNIKHFGLEDELNQLNIFNPGPLGYFEFQNLLKKQFLL